MQELKLECELTGSSVDAPEFGIGTRLSKTMDLVGNVIHCTDVVLLHDAAFVAIAFISSPVGGLCALVDELQLVRRTRCTSVWRSLRSVRRLPLDEQTRRLLPITELMHLCLRR